MLSILSRLMCNFLIFVWLVSIVLPHAVHSFCYDVNQVPYSALPPSPPPGGTTLTFPNDDSYSGAVDIGFTFNFFGLNYPQLVIGSNGLLSFNTSLANGLSLNPAQIAPAGTPIIPNSNSSILNSIMFPWQDLIPATGGGTIFYYTTGVAPNRQFIVVFYQVQAVCQTLETQGVILYEGTNCIDIVIGVKNICSNQGAVEGIQNANGTQAFVVPNRNNTLWSAEAETYRFCPTFSPTIRGPTAVCTGSTVNYSIEPIDQATDYTWSLPPNWTILNGQGTPTIEVIVGDTSGNIFVSIATTDACELYTGQLAVNVTSEAPDQPGPISGPTTACTGSSQTYSIEAVSEATSYTWAVPAGWIIINDTGTSITVIIGNAGGTISVIANNICSSQPQELNINVVNVPTQPGAISGPTTVCPGSSQTYSIETVPGITSYTWNIPLGWIITNDLGTSITVLVGDVGGTVSVTANNACGSSSAQTLAVEVNNLVKSCHIHGPQHVELGDKVTYSVSSKGFVTYDWSYSGKGVKIHLSGKKVTLKFGPNATSGTLSVTVTNDCGVSSTCKLSISIEISPPREIKGKRVANSFATQTDYVHILKWKASSSLGVEFYRIYRNGALIAQVKASQHKFEDHNRPKNGCDVYAVTAVGTNSRESKSIKISIH